MQHVASGSELHTDSARLPDWRRACTLACASIMARAGTSSTNALEGFFNCLRKGLEGTHTHATPEHPSAYADEQAWRFNARKLGEWERFNDVMRLIIGKRLTRSEFTDGATR
ncbi:MAG: transposase [Phycisphaerales bacterium]